LETSKKKAEISRLKNVELKGKNRKLKKLLDELHITQSQLIHSEKMAALGKLVAGIAHEINNPIGAINSTNHVTVRCIEKIGHALADSKRLDELKNSEQFQSAYKILKDNTRVITTAGDRIAASVRSLRNFVRLDEAEFQKVDIHEGIENTLALLTNELRNGVKVVKKYDELPKITCYPSQLNQVIMILLSNAIQVVGSNGIIHIKTFKRDHLINIQISDNGQGIPHDKIRKLFEFDFSKIGSRIKLATGLVTAYNIMQKHKGKIEVQSKVGQGSTFTISLPMDLKADDALHG